MQEGWKTYRLRDIVDQDRGISYGVVQPGKNDPEGIPILKVNNLTNKTFEIENLHHVSTLVESKYLRTRLQGGELLVSLVGSLGEVFLVPKYMKGLNVVRALAVLPIKTEFTAKWVEYVLKSPYYQNKLEQIATSSVQKTINLKELREVEIQIPEVKEREAITSILSALDDKIELNLQQNKTMEEMVMALYKHWFVDFGPFQNGEFVDSELGMIPEGWEVKTLNNFVKIVNGYAFKGKDFIDFGVPVLKIKNVKAGKVIFNNLSYVSEENTSKAKKSKINYKDILITMTGNRMAGSPSTWVGKVAMFFRNGDYYLNQRVSKIQLFDNYEFFRFYLSVMLSSDEFQYYFINNSTSSGGQANISPDLIYGTKIIVPPKDELLEFDKMVSDYYYQVSENEAQNQTLLALRDTLLPKLINGEVQLKEFEQSISKIL